MTLCSLRIDAEYKDLIYSFPNSDIPSIKVLRSSDGTYIINSPAFIQTAGFNIGFQIKFDASGNPYIYHNQVSDVPSNVPYPEIFILFTFPLTVSFLLTQAERQIRYTLNLTNMTGYAIIAENGQLTIINTQLNMLSRLNTLNIPNVVKPRVIITALNTTDGKEISEIVVQVVDVYSYKICKKILTEQFVGEETTSSFYIYNPKFTKVLLGTGCTLYDQISNLAKQDPNTYQTILNYSVIKYAIATLIYGNLNLKYMYRCYNKQFLHDLKNSRFSNFLPLFTIPNPPQYDFTTTHKYFKCGTC